MADHLPRGKLNQRTINRLESPRKIRTPSNGRRKVPCARRKVVQEVSDGVGILSPKTQLASASALIWSRAAQKQFGLKDCEDLAHCRSSHKTYLI